MKRVGKIAHLPWHIRDDLNSRIRDGETGKKLVEWLNSEKDVKHILHLEFNDRPISEQNLSDWRSGGYQDWLRHVEACDILEDIRERHEEIEAETEGKEVGDSITGWLSSEFVRLAHQLLEADSDPQKRWRLLRQILRELEHLRRTDHSAIRANLKRTAWKRQVKQEDEDGKIAAKLGQAQGLFHQYVLEQERQRLIEEEDEKDEDEPVQSSQIKPAKA